MTSAYRTVATTFCVAGLALAVLVGGPGNAWASPHRPPLRSVQRTVPAVTAPTPAPGAAAAGTTT